MLLNESAMGLKMSGKMLMRTEKMSRDAKICEIVSMGKKF